MDDCWISCLAVDLAESTFHWRVIPGPSTDADGSRKSASTRETESQKAVLGVGSGVNKGNSSASPGGAALPELRHGRQETREDAPSRERRER